MACLSKPCTSLFPKYPMCSYNRRANGSWARLESHRSNVCTTHNASHGELDTNTVGLTLQPPIRSEHVNSTYGCLICVSGWTLFVDGTTDLRQGRFAQPTHLASPSAYSAFPTPNTFLRCRQPCTTRIDLQTKAHNAQRCPPYAYKSSCLLT